MTEIDLQAFCSKDALRHNITQPFSNGPWTYATNGYIIVRVPRCADIGDGGPPNAAKMFDESATVPLRPLGKINIGVAPECRVCGGRKVAHACPDCCCPCKACDGTGRNLIESKSVGIGARIFNARYVRMILALGPVKICDAACDNHSPMFFVFDGGEGLVMPMARKYEDHIEEKAS